MERTRFRVRNPIVGLKQVAGRWQEGVSPGMRVEPVAGMGQSRHTCRTGIHGVDAATLYEYDALGRLIWAETPSGAVTYRYDALGHLYESESGLYWMRMRHYHPGLGRFLQPDPIGIAGGLNLYAYANNNPVRWFDPWGLRWVNADEAMEGSAVGEEGGDSGRAIKIT